MFLLSVGWVPGILSRLPKSTSHSLAGAFCCGSPVGFLGYCWNLHIGEDGLRDVALTAAKALRQGPNGMATAT